MGKILLIAFIIVMVVIGCYIFFGSKKSKKDKKKESKETKEKKVEQAIKSDRPKQEKQPEPEEKKVEQPKEEQQKGFRIIRKKSEVKINKKALHAGSRNPSVTKVFDKNNKLEGVETKQKDMHESKREMFQDVDFSKIDQLQKKEEQVGRFGARAVNYDVVNNGLEFQINNPEGTHNRAPIITDRTNFGSHLNEVDSKNPYSISGIGVKQAIVNAQRQATSVDDDTEDMVRKIKKNFLGVEDDIDPFESIRRRMEEREHPQKENQEKPLTKLDAKTLILADAISNPKFKKNIKKD